MERNQTFTGNLELCPEEHYTKTEGKKAAAGSWELARCPSFAAEGAPAITTALCAAKERVPAAWSHCNLFLVAWHLLLEAMHLFLVAWHLFLIASCYYIKRISRVPLTRK